MSQPTAARWNFPPAGSDGSPAVAYPRLIDSIDALLTQHSGSARPGYIKPGAIWLDTSSASLWLQKLWDGANDIVLGSINPSTHVYTNLLASNINLPGTPTASSSPIKSDARNGASSYYFLFDSNDSTAGNTTTTETVTGYLEFVATTPVIIGRIAASLGNIGDASGNFVVIRADLFDTVTGTSVFTGQIALNGNPRPATVTSTVGKVNAVIGRTYRLNFRAWKSNTSTNVYFNDRFYEAWCVPT